MQWNCCPKETFYADNDRIMSQTLYCLLSKILKEKNVFLKIVKEKFDASNFCPKETFYADNDRIMSLTLYCLLSNILKEKNVF